MAGGQCQTRKSLMQASSRKAMTADTKKYLIECAEFHEGFAKGNSSMIYPQDMIRFAAAIRAIMQELDDIEQDRIEAGEFE